MNSSIILSSRTEFEKIKTAESVSSHDWLESKLHTLVADTFFPPLLKELPKKLSMSAMLDENCGLVHILSICHNSLSRWSKSKSTRDRHGRRTSLLGRHCLVDCCSLNRSAMLSRLSRVDSMICLHICARDGG